MIDHDVLDDFLAAPAHVTNKEDPSPITSVRKRRHSEAPNRSPSPCFMSEVGSRIGDARQGTLADWPFLQAPVQRLENHQLTEEAVRQLFGRRTRGYGPMHDNSVDDVVAQVIRREQQQEQHQKHQLELEQKAKDESLRRGRAAVLEPRKAHTQRHSTRGPFQSVIVRSNAELLAFNKAAHEYKRSIVKTAAQRDHLTTVVKQWRDRVIDVIRLNTNRGAADQGIIKDETLDPDLLHQKAIAQSLLEEDVVREHLCAAMENRLKEVQEARAKRLEEEEAERHIAAHAQAYQGTGTLDRLKVTTMTIPSFEEWKNTSLRVKNLGHVEPTKRFVPSGVEQDLAPLSLHGDELFLEQNATAQLAKVVSVTFAHSPPLEGRTERKGVMWNPACSRISPAKGRSHHHPSPPANPRSPPQRNGRKWTYDPIVEEELQDREEGEMARTRVKAAGASGSVDRQVQAMVAATTRTRRGSRRGTLAIDDLRCLVTKSLGTETSFVPEGHTLSTSLSTLGVQRVLSSSTSLTSVPSQLLTTSTATRWADVVIPQAPYELAELHERIVSEAQRVVGISAPPALVCPISGKLMVHPVEMFHGDVESTIVVDEESWFALNEAAESGELNQVVLPDVISDMVIKDFTLAKARRDYMCRMHIIQWRSSMLQLLTIHEETEREGDGAAAAVISYVLHGVFSEMDNRTMSLALTERKRQRYHRDVKVMLDDALRSKAFIEDQLTGKLSDMREAFSHLYRHCGSLTVKRGVALRDLRRCETRMHKASDTDLGSAQDTVAECHARLEDIESQLSENQEMTNAVDEKFALLRKELHRSSLAVLAYNREVPLCNRHRAQQSKLWGPIYRASLAVAYTVCKQLSERIITADKEWKPMLHRIAHFMKRADARELLFELPQVLQELDARMEVAKVRQEIIGLSDPAFDIFSPLSEPNDIVPVEPLAAVKCLTVEGVLPLNDCGDLKRSSSSVDEGIKMMRSKVASIKDSSTREPAAISAEETELKQSAIASLVAKPFSVLKAVRPIGANAHQPFWHFAAFRNRFQPDAIHPLQRPLHVLAKQQQQGALPTLQVVSLPPIALMKPIVALRSVVPTENNDLPVEDNSGAPVAMDPTTRELRQPLDHQFLMVGNGTAGHSGIALPAPPIAGAESRSRNIDFDEILHRRREKRRRKMLAKLEQDRDRKQRQGEHIISTIGDPILGSNCAIAPF